MPTEVKDVQVKAAQSQQAKRATLAMLRSKKPNSEEFTIAFGPDKEEATFLFVSVGAKVYDALLTKYPPTSEQKVAGASFNMNTFGPALLAKVCREPAIDASDWSDLWEADNWGRGELLSLFWKAVGLCSVEVDSVPIVAG